MVKRKSVSLLFCHIMYNCGCYTYSTLTNFQQFSAYNVLNSHFIQLLYSLRMDQEGLKHVLLSGFYIIVNLLQLYVYVGLNYSNNYNSFETWIVSCLMYVVSEGTWFMELTSHVLICWNFNMVIICVPVFIYFSVLQPDKLWCFRDTSQSLW